MFKLFLKFSAGQGARYFQKNRAAKAITVFLFLGVFVGLGTGLFFFFQRGFAFINADKFLGPALSLYSYEIFFLVVGALVFISALISGLFGFFRNESINWFLVSPRFRMTPFYISTRILLSSTWPIIIVVVPGLLAIKSDFGLGLGALFAVFISAVLMAAAAVFFAESLLFIIAKLLNYLGRAFNTRLLTIANVAVVLMVVLIFFAGLFWLRFGHLDIVALLQTYNLQSKVADIQALSTKFAVFPSHLSALALVEFEQGRYLSGLWLVGETGVLAILSLLLFWFFSFWYLELWQILQEGKFVAQTGGAVTGAGAPVRFPRYFKGKQGAIFEKEALVMFRTGKNILWFGFMVILWLIQISLNFFIRENFIHYRVTYGNFPVIFEGLQVAVAIFFISALVLRFGFPSFSLERKTAWIIASAPINFVRLFLTKVLFFSVCFLIVAVLFGFINSAILSIPIFDAFYFLVILISAVISVTVLGLGLGCLFPSFETDNPEILGTSLPGLFFTAVSLAYGAFGAFAFYQIIKSGSFYYFAVFEFFSIVLVAAMVFSTIKRLAKFEFFGR